MESRKPTALILLDHGSRRAAANCGLVSLARGVAEAAASRYLCVEPAHMEVAAPSLDQAFGRCVAAGAERIVVVLFFLAAGTHSTDDVPRLAVEAAALHGDVEYVLTSPLGMDQGIAQLVLGLAEKSLASTP